MRSVKSCLIGWPAVELPDQCGQFTRSNSDVVIGYQPQGAQGRRRDVQDEGKSCSKRPKNGKPALIQLIIAG